MGVLGWPPREFWKASPFELHAALRGYQEKNGQDPEHPEHKAGKILSREEVLELQSLMDEDDD